MAVDSIGNGGKDAAYEARKRALEEERARELTRIEKAHTAQIQKTQDVREKELRDIYTNQTLDLEDKRNEADRRIANVQAGADARIREFEDSTARLTDQAKREFQAKANTLSKQAQDMDQQRQFLVKQHADSMQKLKLHNDEVDQATINKHRREADLTYNHQRRNLNELSAKGQADLEALEADIRDTKAFRKAEAEIQLNSLAREREETAAQMQRNINFVKQEGGEQVKHLQGNLQADALRRQAAYEDKMSQLATSNQHQLNKTHLQGSRKLAETTDVYENQIDSARKNARQKMFDTELRSSVVLSSMEREAKAQEALTQRGYLYKKNLLQQQRDDVLKKTTEDNEKLHKELSTQYQAKAKELIDERNTLLTNQRELLQGEIVRQADTGKKQINAQILTTAKTLTDHRTKDQDPFYQLQASNAKVQDTPTEITVQVFVPEHEQEKVKLTMQKNELTISGSRRAEKRAKTEEGHKVATNSYQTYSESFPVTGKIEMNKMVRAYANGAVIFKIPKG